MPTYPIHKWPHGRCIYLPFRLGLTGEQMIGEWVNEQSSGPAQHERLHPWDITERKLAEERIRLQAQLLSAVGQAAIATDLQGKIIYWNRAAEEMYGWSAEEVMGRPIIEVTPSEELLISA